MRHDISRPLAEKLKLRIINDKGYVLPSIIDLAEEHRVAYKTMWKAMQVLMHQGIVVAPRGKRIAVSPAIRGKAARENETSADQLASRFREQVLSGRYPVGRQLPKIQFLAKSERVAPTTVTRCLRRLARENLVHKQGSRWYAGARPGTRENPARSTFAPYASPVVLLLMADYPDWSITLQSGFIAPFLNAFYAESMRHGNRLVPALRTRHPAYSLDMPTGHDEVRETIRNLGDRWGGVLVLAQFPFGEDLKGWLSMLVRNKMPVVYFDITDTGGHLTRGSLEAGKNFYRVHLDETSAIEKILLSLVARGHKDIGIHGASLGDWMQRRLGKTQACAARIDPSIRIIESGNAEPIWQLSADSEIAQMSSSIAREAGLAGGISHIAIKDRARYREILAQRSPSFLSLLSDRRCTAIMGLNDRMAREYYFICKALGVRVPGDLSLTGFDNAAESVLFPISTVDFGFNMLGYLAAHAFIGDMTIRADRQGNVPGPCEFIDRGSIGTV
jgi:DNA-binding LacI/PurR family transcriptional regulator/DNA-binding transcriptional regulator YhcF (GntR family)